MGCRLAGEAGGPHLELCFALLPGDVQDFAVADMQCHLQQQRGLSDAGLAAQQDDGAGHDAAAEHPVELAEGGGDAGQLQQRDLIDGLRRAFGDCGGGAALGGRLLPLHDLLHEGVPLAARRTAADPLRRLRPAVLAEVLGFALCHALRF